jgi:dienelactone hydrolase
VKKSEACDPKKIAAMGYCFGGTTSLEMARAGMDVVAVASFHGSLATPEPAASIKAKVIVFHGADDKFVNAEVPKFQDEMRAAKADWQFVSFGGTVHSFTVKEAGDDPSKGMAYNGDADRRSWEMLKGFLADAFK